MRRSHSHVEGLRLRDGSHRIDGARGDCFEIVAELALGDAGACRLLVRGSADGRRGLTIRWSAAGLDVAGTEVAAAEPVLADRVTPGALRLHLFLDKAVMELFIADGSAAVTRVNYPVDEDLDVHFFAEGGTAIGVRSRVIWRVEFYPLFQNRYQPAPSSCDKGLYAHFLSAVGAGNCLQGCQWGCGLPTGDQAEAMPAEVSVWDVGLCAELDRGRLLR